MKKSILAVCAAALLLAACGQDEVKSDPNAACVYPNAVQDVENSVRQRIVQEARRFALADARQFVDADKVAGIAAQLQFAAGEAQAESGHDACVLPVSVALPEGALQRVLENAPLLSMADPLAEMNKRLLGSNIRFDGHTVQFPLRYQPAGAQGSSVQMLDAAVDQVSSALSALLLSYGVKDVLLINGRAVAREQLLRGGLDAVERVPEEIVGEGVREVAPIEEESPARVEQNNPPPEPAPVAPKDELAVLAEQSARKLDAAEADAERKSDAAADKVKAAKISAGDLDEADKAHRSAGAAMKSQWQKIVPEVREQLVNEQKDWESRKNQNCRRASAKAADSTESRYLMLQCDTRLTRERTQYLRGFSLED